jgi:hypothetical protein
LHVAAHYGTTHTRESWLGSEVGVVGGRRGHGALGCDLPRPAGRLTPRGRDDTNAHQGPTDQPPGLWCRETWRTPRVAREPRQGQASRFGARRQPWRRAKGTESDTPSKNQNRPASQRSCSLGRRPDRRRSAATKTTRAHSLRECVAGPSTGPPPFRAVGRTAAVPLQPHSLRECVTGPPTGSPPFRYNQNNARTQPSRVREAACTCGYAAVHA